jgi:hypothetical protein
LAFLRMFLFQVNFILKRCLKMAANVLRLAVCRPKAD